jgi:hypothetical protein
MEIEELPKISRKQSVLWSHKTTETSRFSLQGTNFCTCMTSWQNVTDNILDGIIQKLDIIYGCTGYPAG